MIAFKALIKALFFVFHVLLGLLLVIAFIKLFNILLDWLGPIVGPFLLEHPIIVLLTGAFIVFYLNDKLNGKDHG